MDKFYIWTIGCQMNKADSERLANSLKQLGFRQTDRAEAAQIIVLNSCVVRQSAEDKVINKLANLKTFKRKHPNATVVLTGCMVDSNTQELKRRFPQVDFFLKPQHFDELLAHAENIAKPGKPADGSTPLPAVTAFVPIIHGCNNFCSYCIVPYRRGREKSRPMHEIIDEIRQLVSSGVKEVTLLGQNVDSYGHDLPDKPDLADLLHELNQIDRLVRIRFLTSHPKDMSQKLIQATASLDKVCEHISLPAQSGDNEILKMMRRGYTVEQYTDLINRIRAGIPGVALSNDVIVGFPGESPQQFRKTYELLEQYRFDTVHAAAYSPRPGTIASRKLEDDVPAEEKQFRLKQVEELQERISHQINTSYMGRTVEVLVENQKGGKWQGRTRTDKPVFFNHESNWIGKIVHVKVTHAGPWSLQGELIRGDFIEG